MTSNHPSQRSSSPDWRDVLFVGDAILGIATAVKSLLEPSTNYALLLFMTACVVPTGIGISWWLANRKVRAGFCLLVGLAFGSLALTFQHPPATSDSKNVHLEVHVKYDSTDVTSTPVVTPTIIVTMPVPSSTATAAPVEPTLPPTVIPSVVCRVTVKGLYFRPEPTLDFTFRGPYLAYGTYVEVLDQQPSSDGGVWLFVKARSGAHDGKTNWIKGGPQYVSCTF